MGRLLTPTGEPTTWAELLALNERYWQAEDRLPRSAVCIGAVRGAGAKHWQCSGSSGNARDWTAAPCGCECHLGAS